MRRTSSVIASVLVVLAVSGCSRFQAEYLPIEPVRHQASVSPVTNDNPRPAPAFVNMVSAADPGRYVGTMNLYGEMPGSPKTIPNDALDNLQQVSFTREGADFDADVDPTGQWLIYASTRHRPTSDLYIKRVEGTAITQLTDDPANDTMPAISPNGKLVAFCSDRSGSWDLYIKPVSGGKAVQLTSGPAQDLHPSWSPDGGKIVYSSLGEQSGQWELAIIDVANPINKQFIGYGLFPEFSPTGNKIAFQRARFRGTRWFSLWTIDYIDGEASQPTEVAVSTNAAVITPTWSPDGKRLAFVTVVNPGNDPRVRPDNSNLWVINADGTGRINLTNDRYVNLQPTWGRNGRLYFVTNRGAADNIWATRVDQPLLAGSGSEKEPAQTQAMVPTE